MSLWIPTPSYKNGFARNAAESANPGLWDGLVGAWAPSLGVTGGTLRDQSGFGRHGSNPAAWVMTELGYGIDIAGANPIQGIPTPALPGDLTLAFWIKPADVTSGAYTSDFSGTNEFATVLGYQSGFYNVYGVQYPIGNNAANSQIPASGNGIWDHVAWTKRGTILKGYVNGVEEMSGTITSGDFVPSAGLTIGARDGGAIRIDALLANYIIWSRALAPNQIQQLYVDPHALFRPRGRTIFAAGAAPPAFGGISQVIGGGIVAA